MSRMHAMISNSIFRLLRGGLPVLLLILGGILAFSMPVCAEESGDGTDDTGDPPVAEIRETKLTPSRGWQTIQKRRYYFRDGKPLTGWQQIDDDWYYFHEEGNMDTLWGKIDGKTYYFGKDGARRTGWKKIDGYMYYFDASGVRQTGWLELKGHRYYLGKHGKAAVGWTEIHGKKYYFSSGGKAVRGWEKIGKKWYYFNEKGKLLTDQVVGKYYVNAKGERVSKLPSSKQLKVRCIAQRPELPMGCEVTSLAIALNYHGFAVNKCYLSDHFLPKGSSGSVSPYDAFIGNPRSYSGWYCYSPAIVKTANSYFKQNHSSAKAVNLSGSSFDSLLYEISAGRPVVIWGTLGMGSPATIAPWYVHGTRYTRYVNLHCVVLTGYDKKKGVVYIADPLRGNRTLSMSLVRTRYQQMGSQAVVIRN